MNRLGILVSPSTRSLVAALALIGPAALASSGCNTNDEPYKAAPAWTGRKPSLPAPPTINVTVKNGDAYTVVDGGGFEQQTFIDICLWPKRPEEPNCTRAKR